LEKILKKATQKIEEYKKKALFEVTRSQILSEIEIKFLKKLFVVFIELISFQIFIHQERTPHIVEMAERSDPFVDFTLLATQPDLMTS
jgi:hypothetical protein